MCFVILAVVLLASSLGGVSTGTSGLGPKLDPIVKPHAFSLVSWEFRTLASETLPSLFRHAADAGDTSTVLEYFAVAERARTLEQMLDTAADGNSGHVSAIESELNELLGRQKSLERGAERVLEKQIRYTAAGVGIYNPLVDIRITFPPVDFKLTKPPHLLVVSPRDRIESVDETMLQPEMTLEEMEEIENAVDRLGVSSLVTGIGGLGATYPTFVANNMDLRSAINTAAHEWLHQYLAFRPLGFLYVLDLTGVRQNRDIVSMNETLANIAGNEIGDLVYEKYYAGNTPESTTQKTEGSTDPAEGTVQEPGSPFDFNREMRDIRRTVDLMLAQGRVEEAERFMNEKRDYLEEKGYYIRRLNQAYFAFYGAYSDSPTSIDPIGTEMKKLRSESASLREFLARVSAMTGREALREAAGG